MKDEVRKTAVRRCAVTSAISASGTQRAIDALMARLRAKRAADEEGPVESGRA